MQNHEKKLMFITGYMGNGGSERVISVLANEFVKKGYEVSILAILGDKQNYNLNNKIKYIPFEGKGSNQFTRVINRILFIRKHIKLLKCNYIISFMAQINIYAILANTFSKARLIVSERNDPNQDPSSKITRIIRDVLYRYVDGVVFQTIDAKKYFSAKIQKRSTVISNPLKEDLPLPFTGIRRKEIVTGARLEEQKNLKMLISAFYKVHMDHSEYILKIFGEGPLRNELIEYSESLGIGDKVIFAGFSNNLHQEIREAAMFVLTSNYEGISNSLIEALALGIPVISTDHPIGGARMFIKSGVNGFLVPVNDTEETYIAMNKLINSPNLCEVFSKNAIGIRDELHVSKITSEWERFIIREE